MGNVENKENIQEANSVNRHSEQAVKLFKEGYNCSQAVFTAFAKDYGLDEKTALKLSASFGGGMGRMREVCGCVSAMFMVAGMETGATEKFDNDGKAYNYKVVQELADKFRKLSGGSIVCRELLGLTKPEGTNIPEERTDEYYKKRPCIQLVCDACDIIEEYFGK